MGNQCKECTQELQTQTLKTQQNLQSNNKLFSFGIENSLHFEYNSINVVPQFEQPTLKLKVFLTPPTMVRQLSEESFQSLQELDDQKETFQVCEQQMKKQLTRIQSQEQIAQRPSPIRKRNFSESYNVQKPKKKKSPSNIDKNYRSSLWDSRTINQQLRQAKQTFVYCKAYQCQYIQNQESINGEKNSKFSTLSALTISKRDQVRKNSQVANQIQYQSRFSYQKVNEQRIFYQSRKQQSQFFF
ncbi:unnamed protein product [Paramecium sonneborni]|uniref:Uncharacterized protein n=1 Tax=Paramecium sonneborni TaxID=65129 RepID=A0A8S1L1L0_9CILI|nr:unnamed protein product [Paramecium sonneborni]